MEITYKTGAVQYVLTKVSCVLCITEGTQIRKVMVFLQQYVMSLFHLRLRDTSSRNPPPGDPSGGVVYLRIVLSPEEASQLMGNS